MDHFDKTIEYAKPNQAPGKFSSFVGFSLGHEGSSSGLMDIDGKTFLKTVGQKLLAANYDVKGHAGQKRSTSRKSPANKSASATRKSKSAGTKTAAKKTSKPRKNSAKKSPKPKKKSAGSRKASKSRKNSTDKKKPKPKKPSKENAGADPQQRS